MCDAAVLTPPSSFLLSDPSPLPPSLLTASERPHMCATSKSEACSLHQVVDSMMLSLYWIGMDQPAKGTILPVQQVCGCLGGGEWVTAARGVCAVSSAAGRCWFCSCAGGGGIASCWLVQAWRVLEWPCCIMGAAS